MKVILKLRQSLVLVTLLAIGFTACKKSNNLGSLVSKNGTVNGAVAIAPISTIMGTSQTTNSTDSVYAMDACHSDHKRTSITQNALPAVISSYLNSNYAGFTFIKAFSTTNTSTNILDAYVVAINFNGKPVALKFDASGNFIKVLELREGKDMKEGHDHHEGGSFDNRDHEHRDSLSLSALPSSIKNYFATNYAQDTLKGAFVNKDSSIIVISKNVVFYATAFKADGTFIKRDTLPARHGDDHSISQSALPANILSYLSTTYPNYVFEKAFADVDNGTVKGYLVIIDANLTKYAVVFDGSGTFVKAKIIR